MEMEKRGTSSVPSEEFWVRLSSCSVFSRRSTTAQKRLSLTNLRNQRQARSRQRKRTRRRKTKKKKSLRTHCPLERAENLAKPLLELLLVGLNLLLKKRDGSLARTSRTSSTCSSKRRSLLRRFKLLLATPSKDSFQILKDP